MNQKLAKLRSLAMYRILAAGLDWESIDCEAKQIIIFGSHALDTHKRNSDLDVLCVGNGQSFKSKTLHVIWVSKKRIQSKTWQKSELATHVARYGKWIKGINNWAHRTKPGRDAMARKKKNILARLSAMNRHWNDLLPVFQKRQIIMLRRDLQRYRMMRQGLAPVPKPLLDLMWKRYGEKVGWVKLLSLSANISEPVKTFLRTHVVVDHSLASRLAVQAKDIGYHRNVS